MKEKKFKFSVVVPIYKVEAYLDDTIQSVIHQTYGFKQHIQMILVNDGSPDNSEAICLKYQAMYPDNILYIKQENRGVSAARNNGLRHAAGEYVNFLDSDDTWEPDAFAAIAHFAGQNPQAEIIACRMKFFEASEAYHPLDYKFKDARMIRMDDDTEYQSNHLHVTSSVIKTERAKTLQFDETMILGEDALYLNTLILQAGAFAVLPQAQHNYRKRFLKSSAIQTKESNPRFYNETIHKFYRKLIEISISRYGRVLPYVQNLLVYDIGWRVQKKLPKKLLNEQEKADYLNALHEIACQIEDKIILASPSHRSIFVKSALLRLKYGEDVLNKLTYRKKTQKLYFNGIKMASIPKNPNNCEFFNIEHQGDSLLAEGLIKSWIIDADCTTGFVLAFAGKEYPVELKPYPHDCETTMFGTFYRYYQFSVRIPFDSAFADKKKRWLRPRLYFSSAKCDTGTRYGGRRMLGTLLCPAAYKLMDAYYFTATPQGVCFVKPADLKKAHLRLELKLLKWLLQNKHANMCLIRLLYHIKKRFKKKPLWIISDRPDTAHDNGEAFFRYLAAQNPTDITFKFVMDKDAPDAARLKKIGRVAYFGTKKYQLDYLLADKIISSQANDFILNAFSIWDNRYIRDLCTFDFIFLQHGIIMNDLSDWLQKRNKKIDLFVTSAQAEKDSIVNGNYGLDAKNVILTGLPRFDHLFDEKSHVKKQILIMPTWRRSIKQSYDKDCRSVYFDKFNKTAYFHFFNSLINDPRLTQVMRMNGYTGVFCLHPIHAKQAVDFEENDVFSVVKGAADYPDLFTKSALMVTDYSSTFFDFCYLRKPVIYAQFDQKDFFAGQIYDEGYFKYERDGFGPVCAGYDATIDEIIRFIENGCVLDSEYQKRIDRFYAYNDNQNCKRIEEAIRSYKA